MESARLSSKCSALSTAQPTAIFGGSVAGSGAAPQVQLPHFSAFVARSHLLFQVRLASTKKMPRCRNPQAAASGTEPTPTPDALFVAIHTPEAPCHAGGPRCRPFRWPYRRRKKIRVVAAWRQRGAAM